MQSIQITRSEETPQWVTLNIDFVTAKIELQIRVYEAAEQGNEEDTIIVEQTPGFEAVREESPEEKKRRKAKEYYDTNKERLREDARQRYQAKKSLSVPIVEEEDDIPDNLSELSEEESLVFDYDPSLNVDENATLREERQNYYQNHLTEIRQYYQDNKERIAKRQQTDEVRAKFREQYKSRREKLTPGQIVAKNAIASAQRKVRELKLKAKYPDCRTLKAAKAAEKARREVI